MAVFPCTFFTISTKYPDSGVRVRLGKSYLFTAPSTSPDQRIFQLSLQGMQYFLTPTGTIDATVHPERNLAVLDQFYQTHKLHTAFDFNHPAYGLLRCKFNAPLEIPEGIPGADGVVNTVNVELIEIP